MAHLKPKCTSLERYSVKTKSSVYVEADTEATTMTSRGLVNALLWACFTVPIAGLQEVSMTYEGASITSLGGWGQKKLKAKAQTGHGRTLYCTQQCQWPIQIKHRSESQSEQTKSTINI
eukprot:scaffold19604_cov60-Attheya_sp.AAC.5